MNVVVTGASGGIGTACVEEFKAHGASVFGVDIEEESVADEHLAVDLASPDCGVEVSDWLSDHEVDVLVNNAAYAEYVAAIETDVSTWNRTIAVNLRAPFLLATALHPKLQASAGSVVNIASIHAVATSSGVAAYAASKGGLVSLTRALALEWAPEVRVNAVLPGAVDTEMLSAGMHRSAGSLDELGERHPLGRVAEPAEVAQAVVFLAGSTFMTGSALTVDGGATARLSTE